MRAPSDRHTPEPSSLGTQLPTTRLPPRSIGWTRMRAALFCRWKEALRRQGFDHNRSSRYASVGRAGEARPDQAVHVRGDGELRFRGGPPENRHTVTIELTEARGQTRVDCRRTTTPARSRASTRRRIGAEYWKA